jgi:hypothetical protein
MEANTDNRISAEDLEILRRARRTLEQPSLAIRATGKLGAPVEMLINKLPRVAQHMIDWGAHFALRRCLSVALRTLRKQPGGEPRESHDMSHKLAVGGTGAVGGAFGFISLPIELPLTTTLMFRSICAIARAEGEDLSQLETRLQCMAVFSLGGSQPLTAEEEESRAAEFGYFALRGTLAQAISKVSAESLTKGFLSPGSAAVANVLQAITTRFSSRVGEQAVAKSLPLVGAVFGAGTNALFLDHYQQIAHAHFSVRRLERKYGETAIRSVWPTLDISH